MNVQLLVSKSGTWSQHSRFRAYSWQARRQNNARPRYTYHGQRQPRPFREELLCGVLAHVGTHSHAPRLIQHPAPLNLDPLPRPQLRTPTPPHRKAGNPTRWLVAHRREPWKLPRGVVRLGVKQFRVHVHDGTWPHQPLCQQHRRGCGVPRVEPVTGECSHRYVMHLHTEHRLPSTDIT